MSRWVKQEYEGVLAFIFIAIATFIPWNVTIANVDGISIYSLRWWIAELRYIPAITELENWYWIHEIIALESGQSGEIGYLIWAAGTALFIPALLIGAALLFKEETISERYPIHLIAGGLLTGCGAIYLAANIYWMLNGIPGTYAPIGAIFYLIMGGFLLTNRVGTTPKPDQETTDSDEPDTVDEPEIPTEPETELND